MSGIGHNTLAGNKLAQYIEQVEALKEERATIVRHINGVFADAKANGFDTKIMRKCIALRAMRADERQEMESLLDAYMHALGAAALEG